MTRTMISVNIDRSDPVLLHDQVAAEIRRAIAEGEAGPGDRLPLAKDSLRSGAVSSSFSVVRRSR